MKYLITKSFKSIVVDVPDEQRGDRVRIPMTIYNACWWDRLLNNTVEITRFDDDYQQSVFFGPANKMSAPEIVL